MMTPSQLSKAQLDGFVTVLNRIYKTDGKLDDFSIWLDSSNRKSDVSSTSPNDDLDESHFTELRSSLQTLKDFRCTLQYLHKSLEKNIYDLQQKCNRIAVRSGMRMLPEEILGYIFEFSSSPIILSHVCKRFRKLTLDMPRLWDTISAELPAKHVELYLERSRSLPLSVTFGYRGDFERYMKFIPLALPHMQRWSRLIVEGKIEAVEEHLRNTAIGKARVHLPALSGHYLYSHSGTLELIKAPLSELGIIYNGDHLNLPKLTTQLGKLPKLTRLTLIMIRISSYTSVDQLPVLKSVKSLKLVCNSCIQETISELFLKLRFPKLQSLNLIFEEEDNHQYSFLSDVFWIRQSLAHTITTLNFKAASIESYIVDVLLKTLNYCPALVHFTVHISQSKKTFQPRASLSRSKSKVWSMKHPLKWLILYKCDSVSDSELDFIGQQLRLGPTWEQFKRMDVVHCKSVSEEFFFKLEDKMDGKLCWVLQSGRNTLFSEIDEGHGSDSDDLNKQESDEDEKDVEEDDEDDDENDDD